MAPYFSHYSGEHLGVCVCFIALLLKAQGCPGGRVGRMLESALETQVDTLKQSDIRKLTSESWAFKL